MSEPDRPYHARSRGIGSETTPGCFCCGGDRRLYNNISLFVPTRETGEAIVSMFASGAYLDYRSHEPDWIQVKIGACDLHLRNLEQLDAAVAATRKPDTPNSWTFITHAMIRDAIRGVS